jgi:hypothetical protein
MNYSKLFTLPAILVIGSLLFITLYELLPPLAIIEIEQYAYLEQIGNQLLLSLILALLLVGVWMKSEHVVMTLILGASLGLLFFINVLGLKMVDPTQIHWLMQGDWATHFLGWHFFRNEPWQFPLGKLTNYYFPLGTSIGYTDSLPLFALPLKLFSSWLPDNFQYIGLWLLSCYVLQGVFAALLIRLVSRNLLIQALGTLFFVMSPVLLNRLAHDTLCAHWLLLAGLWMYFRSWEQSPYRAFAFWIVIVGISALVHPYLAMMVLGLAAAFYARFWLIERHCTLIAAIGRLAFLGAMTLFLWWQVGYFLIENQQMSGEGLGYYSMNLLAPFNAMGNSIFFKEIPLATGGQYEGFNYLGAGVLLMGFWALYELHKQPAQQKKVKNLLPLALVCVVFTMIAISNKVTLANIVLVDFQHEWLTQLGIFRSSGRFFWSVNYLLIFLILSVLISRHSARSAFMLLSFGLMFQTADLFPSTKSHYQVRDEPTQHWNPSLSAWDNPLKSPLWKKVAPYYQHITLIPPPPCGKEAVPYQPFSYLAGSFGMTINTGYVARLDIKKVIPYCNNLLQDIQQGKVRDDTVYLLHIDYLEKFQKAAQSPLLCAKIDGFDTCVTKQSYAKWKEK